MCGDQVGKTNQVIQVYLRSERVLEHPSYAARNNTVKRFLSHTPWRIALEIKRNWISFYQRTRSCPLIQAMRRQCWVANKSYLFLECLLFHDFVPFYAPPLFLAIYSENDARGNFHENFLFDISAHITGSSAQKFLEKFTRFISTFIFFSLSSIHSLSAFFITYLFIYSAQTRSSRIRQYCYLLKNLQWFSPWSTTLYIGEKDLKKMFSSYLKVHGN